MGDRLYLGVDGGGTTTRARLTDEAGRILGEGTAGSSNLTLGPATALPAILAAADRALEAAGLSPIDRPRVHAGFGLAGGNVISLADAISADLAARFRSVAVASDAVAACLGAHAGEDGAILILGTGSQGLALVGGRATPVGGWGFALSDEGSGAILGRALMRAAILAVDELGPDTPLTRAVIQRFARDPGQAAIWATTATPRDYAALVPLVFEHRSGEDIVATALIDDACRDIARLVDRLLHLGARRVCLVGGLAAPYRPYLPERLAPVLAEPQADAMDGALRLARSASAHPSPVLS